MQVVIISVRRITSQNESHHHLAWLGLHSYRLQLRKSTHSLCLKVGHNKQMRIKKGQYEG